MMKKINNNLIAKGLIFMAVLTLGATLSNHAEARVHNRTGFYVLESGGGYNGNNNFQNYAEPIIYSLSQNKAVVESGTVTVHISGENFMRNSVVRWNGFDRATTYYDNSHLSAVIPTSGRAVSRPMFVYNPTSDLISNGVEFSLRNVVSSNTDDSDLSAVSNTADEDGAEKASDLAGNALFGANGFMPANLVQWIIAAILILIIVILVRKAYGAEDKYHKTPLKHA